MKKLILEQFTSDEFKELLSDVIKSELSQLKLETPLSNEDNYLLTRKEVAKLLRISLPTLHDWTNKDIIQSYSLGLNRRRYKRDEVLAMLNAKK